MRRSTSLFPLAASLAMGFTLTTIVFLHPETVDAAESGATAADPKATENQCGCPPQKEKLWVRPKFAEVPSMSQPIVLDETDHVAALESVQFALTEVGDGATYVWHRNNGRLSGLVQPVNSFKDDRGQVCRHVIVILTSGVHSKKAEGVACRLTSGQWRLEG